MCGLLNMNQVPVLSHTTCNSMCISNPKAYLIETEQRLKALNITKS